MESEIENGIGLQKILQEMSSISINIFSVDKEFSMVSTKDSRENIGSGNSEYTKSINYFAHGGKQCENRISRVVKT